MKEKVAKKLETNVAELIMICVFLAVFLSSCGGGQYLPCPAYSDNDELWGETQEEYHASLDCENCDEID